MASKSKNQIKVGRPRIRTTAMRRGLFLIRSHSHPKYLSWRKLNIPTSRRSRDSQSRVDALEMALSHIERALDATPDDVDTQLEAGRVFQALAEASPKGRKANLARARRAYAQAATLDPELAAAPSFHASTYLIEGEDPAMGLPFVTRAYRKLPGSLEIQLLFARLEAGRGKISPARTHAAEVASRGHGLDIEDEAMELIESLRQR